MNLKVEELLERRLQLRGQKKSILKQIEEETKKMNKVDLEEFIRSGNAGKVDGFELDKLQRKRKHLVLLGESLDQAIVEAQNIERQRLIAKMLRKADKCSQARARLSDKIRFHLLKAQRLQKEARTIRVEEDSLRHKAKAEDRQTFEVSHRLGKLEEFLEGTILIGNEIEEKVLAAREHNRKLLKKERVSINDKVFQNFRVKWDRKTLKVLEFELTEQSAELLLRAEYVTRESLLKEIC